MVNEMEQEGGNEKMVNEMEQEGGNEKMVNDQGYTPCPVVEQAAANTSVDDFEFLNQFASEFDPFFGEEAAQVHGASMNENYVNTEEENNQVHEASMNENYVNTEEVGHENKYSSGSEEDDDSDFYEDEDNVVDDVAVDMRTFKMNIDFNEEWIGEVTGEGENVEVHVEEEVLDLDNFDSGTDDEHDGKRKKALKRLRKEQKKKSGSITLKTHFFVGQTFPNNEAIKEQVSMHAIETRRQLHFKKNDAIRMRVICKGNIPIFTEDNDVADGGGASVSTTNDVADGGGASRSTTKGMGKVKIVNAAYVETNTTCPWVLHISKGKVDGTWMVKTYVDTHKCLQTRSVKQCTSTFLSREIEETIGSNPDIPIKALKDQIQRKFEVGVSEMKVFRAKVMAEKKLRGDYSLQYTMLRDYCLEIKRTNPDTTIKIDVEPEGNPAATTRQFRRIYVCLGPLKKGFKCLQREVLGLDGCFMKGPYPGQILTAVGIDSNNGIYPLAYAVVEAENTNAWCWFLESLGEDLDLSPNSNFTFISDRQKGIIPAIAKVFPSAEHRYCLRHIHENMKINWKGGMFMELLWKCATSTTIPHFQKCMEELKKVSQPAYEWVKQIPPRHWSRSHFSGRSNFDVLLNNLCEVFNRQLVKGRDKPIITCLDYIREYLMRRIVIVQKTIEGCDGPLTPTATKLFNQIKKDAVQFKVVWNGSNKYEVTGPWDDKCVVDVIEKTCTCRKWELTGMPCKHDVVAIWDMGLHNIQVGIHESWCHKAYWIETWKKAYEFKVEPINGRSMWPKSDCPTSLRPPKHHTQAGRPKKIERSQVMSCKVKKWSMEVS